MTVLTLSDRSSFELDDGTGRVRVEPESARLEAEVERVRVQAGQPPPDALASWAVGQGYADPRDLEGAREYGLEDRLGDLLDGGSDVEHLTQPRPAPRRYTERVIAEGEQTYVLGGAQPREDAPARPSNPENLVVREHEGTGQFILGDKAETELVESKLSTAIANLALGVLVLLLGLVGLADTLGVV